MELEEIKGWLKSGLERLKQAGVDYADARYVARETEKITLRNEQVAALARDHDRGFGIRVLYQGSWGFASSATLTEAEVMKVAEQALEI